MENGIESVNEKGKKLRGRERERDGSTPVRDGGKKQQRQQEHQKP